MTGRAYPRRRAEYGTYQWYQSQLGRMDPQMGPDPATWEHGAVEFYHDIINRGAQRVYHLDSVGDGSLHKWSFLRSRFTIQTTGSKSDYLLPEDCASVIGNLSFDKSDSGYSQVFKGSVADILRWRSINTDVSGYPERYAEEFQDSGGIAPQGRSLLLWPTPDKAYTLNGEMDIMPMDMDEEHRPYGYGGRPLVEALLNSMMALMDPQYEGYYQRRLMAAIQSDLSHNQPEFLGKNLNQRRSWIKTKDDDGRFIEFDPVTYKSFTG